jgi:hypothetical protein
VLQLWLVLGALPTVSWHVLAATFVLPLPSEQDRLLVCVPPSQGLEQAVQLPATQAHACVLQAAVLAGAEDATQYELGTVAPPVPAVQVMERVCVPDEHGREQVPQLPALHTHGCVPQLWRRSVGTAPSNAMHTSLLVAPVEAPLHETVLVCSPPEPHGREHALQEEYVQANLSGTTASEGDENGPVPAELTAANRTV